MNAEVVLDLEPLAWPALLVDAQGVIHQANAAALKALGAAVGKPPATLAGWWPESNPGTAADFLSQWRPAAAAPAFLPLNLKVAGGGQAPFHAALCPAPDQRLVLQLLPAAPAPGGPALLQQKLDCMLQLAQTVSLDFNNALTGVLAHTSWLLTKTGADHPWRAALLEMEKSATRAAGIVAELAHFSRADKEARRAPPGNLNQVASRCVGVLSQACAGRVAWNLLLESHLFEARFDEAKIEQAVAKILENAVESFGREGTGSIVVQTRNVELTQPTQDRTARLAPGAHVCLEVSDGGAGIAAEVLPRIFEPFFTTKPPPHRGLGLALVYGILSNHGGGVAVSSQAGQGTSARLYLPAETTRVQAWPAATEGLRGTGTVLVVDDEPLLLTMAETILSDFGYRVLTAGSGAAALRLLADPESRIDLVLTDLVMPGMDGRELMDRIRKLGLPVPILCTSGYVQHEQARTAPNYLPKPFSSAELLAKVKTAINPRADSPRKEG